MDAQDAELRRLARRVDAPYDATSDSNDSQEEAATAPTKKRKPTYYVRKDEKAALEKELEQLQARIRQLESTHHGSAKKALDQSMALNAVLSADVEINNLALAGAQSMISAEMVSRFRNPVDHYIYLPDDAALRRESLRSIKALKLEAALRLTRERMRHLDIRQPHRHCETTVLKSGDFVMTLFDVTLFEGYSDARVVFEQFQAYVMSQEMSISELLGTLSIRETDEPADPAVRQCRLVTTVTPGVHVESNLVMCSRFFDALADDQTGTTAYGIGTVDYIDKDDVYPYQSATRVRMDVSASAYFTQTMPDPDDPQDCAGISVSMVRFATVRLHLPRFPLTRQQLAAARTHASKWGDVMPQAMQERLGLLYN